MQIKTLRIPSLLLLALVLILTILNYRQSMVRENVLFLQMDFQADEAGVYQVFFDHGNSFNEQDKIEWPVDNNPKIRDVVSELPQKILYRIRIDPINNPSPYMIGNIRIKNANGNVVHELNTSSIQAIDPKLPFFRDGNHIYSSPGSNHSDPAFEYIFPEPVIFSHEIPLEKLLSSFFKDYRKSLFILVLICVISGKLFPYAGIAWVFWIIFDPGFYTPDSIDTIVQAHRGSYWNQHPPTMAWLIRHWFNLGLSVRDLIFAQSLLGIFGIRFLILSFVNILPNGDNMRPLVKEAISLLIVVLFVTPLSPLAFYLNTLWKDSWAVIQFTWLTALLFMIMNEKTSKSKLRLFYTGSALILMFLIILTRYNAILLTPIFALILVLLHKRLSLLAKGLVFVLLIILFFAAKPFVHKTLNVWEVPIENQMITLDLIGFYKLYPNLRDELPYTKANLSENWEDRFDWANVYPISFNHPLIVSEEYGSYTSENPKLKKEYFDTAKSYPLRMLAVKWNHFIRLLGWESTHYWYANSIVPNEVGLTEKLRFKGLRSKINLRTLSVGESPLRWIFGVHLIWIVINFAATLMLCLQYLKTRNLDQIVWILISLIPTIYYFSYMIAAPARDYRYMYPASIVLQVTTLAFVFTWIFKKTIPMWSSRTSGPTQNQLRPSSDAP